MVVLKGVPALLSPELLYALARMGHGDEIGEGRGQGLGTPTLGRGASGTPATPGPTGVPTQTVPQPGGDDSQAREEPGPGVEALVWPPRPTSQ